MGEINKEDFESIKQERDELARVINILKLEENRRPEMEKAFADSLKAGSHFGNVSVKEFFDFRKDYFTKNKIKHIPD